MKDKVMLEIANFCECCPSRECCPEKECVLFRIEQIVIKQRKKKKEHFEKKEDKKC